MTLKKKFLPFVDDIDLINEKPNKEKRLRNANKCEEIEDEFAIGFAEWLNFNFKLDFTDNAFKELLEVFKKEKQL